MLNTKRQQNVPGNLHVRDFMTSDPICVGLSTTPRELARLLTDHAISGVPVVDAQHQVIGVVSRTDLLQWCLRGGLGFGSQNILQSLAEGGTGTRVEAVDLGIVSDFMTTSLITASPDEPVSQVARRMREKHVHRVVVVDAAGRLVGVLTTFDLLCALAEC
jgi:CBS domain-containing protein